MDEQAAAREAAAVLQAWREQGADCLDPVRFHFMEALARRAAGHAGQARRILHDKLGRLLAAYRDDLERVAPAAAGDASEPASGVEPGPLAALAERLEASRREAEPIMGGADASGELAVLEYFRQTWATLSVGRELRRSSENVPENAGPLNSLHLVHRSLTLMQQVAPEYLRHFLSYADALSWMEQLAAGPAPPRAEGPKKTARGRAA
ncbi:MAG: DUF2894 domain-containing protein [Pigmentiphaga sp.]|uniref:DUF2894 domain-containing protein n=1 Tax=Pigmentiphaga sp. TaxID=1977564 RepID=UPI0029AF5FE2|nr:DUF2894 domain-containing protein [Pigmentiphaga sp.]MDX3905154.1 DUF2894 domain-containing protein [Pigmentiphaga sp.]